MRRLWVALAICTIAAGGAALEDLWKDAVTLHQAGKLPEAEAKYREVLAASPNYVPALANLGAIASQSGRYGDAVERFREALQHAPGHPGIRLNLALGYYKQNLLADAASILEPLAREQPANQQAALLLADSWLRLGENAKVIALLEPWAQKSPDDRAIAYVLGTALIRNNDVARGQRIVDRVFQAGESAEALMLLGAAQHAAQDNKTALATLEKALQLNPKLPGLQSLYGQALLTDGNPEAAKQAFHAELAQNSTDFEANFHLGSLYRVEKDYERAAALLEKARLMRPGSIALKYQIASLQMATGQLPEATRLLEEVTREAPDFVEAHISLATAYYRQKRKEDGDRQKAIVDELNAKVQEKDLKVK